MTKTASTTASMNIIRMMDLITNDIGAHGLSLLSLLMTHKFPSAAEPFPAILTFCLSPNKEIFLPSFLLWGFLVFCDLEYETLILKEVLLSQAIGWDLELCLISSFCLLIEIASSPLLIRNANVLQKQEAAVFPLSLQTGLGTGWWQGMMVKLRDVLAIQDK